MIRLAQAGAEALIEPIKTRVDMPGYLLDGTRLALECNAAAGTAAGLAWARPFLRHPDEHS